MKKFTVTLLFLFLVGWFASGDEPPFKPGKLPKDEVARLQPGLIVRFFRDEKLADARRVRLAALHVPAGAAPTPWLTPGPFTAKVSGFLKTAIKSEVTLRAVALGKVRVAVNGKELFTLDSTTKEAPLELAKGYNLLEVTLAAPAQGPASFRLYWSGEGFGSEPLPPETLFSHKDEMDLVHGQQLREGRVLYATLGCAHCHALPGKLSPKDCAMPEVEHRAPNLSGAGQRLDEAWIARWLQDPRSLRPDATMPILLHGDQASQQAADLAGYLASLKGDAPQADSGDAAQGEKLFGRLGCIACHHLQDPAKEDNFGRVSLFFVRAKFQPGALKAFLQAPHKNYPWIRMPDFKLTDAEAGSLAVYLASQAQGKVVAPQKGDPQRGATLFRDLGCVNCHAVKSDDPPVHGSLAPPAALDKGCLGADKKPRVPNYRLHPDQFAALRKFLMTDGSSLTRETAAEFSLRQVAALQCSSCHRRDGAFSRWQYVLEDEGTQPEFLPSLSWAGQKLKPAWTVKLLLGQHDQRARPWLKARMPAFPARAETLAVGMSHEHGYGIDEDPRPRHDAALAEIGKKLIPAMGGFNCVQCHGIGKVPPVAPFEAPGINLLDASLRLRYEYYPRWMVDPPRVDITTRMPKFAADGQMTPLRDVLGGDARKQFDAIWHYMQTLPDANP